MTTIRATCPTCGEVDMAPNEIFLSVREPASVYRFVCPACSRPIEKAADRKIVAMLLSAGVNLGDGRAPVPSVRAGGESLPPFTTQDLRAFHRLLLQDHLVAQLVEGP
ncbi:MAG: hypothetical protein LC722_02510 [Actinobacteria bacterium]|nr:hypothetical protein [Actinomycetota bacterium]